MTFERLSPERFDTIPDIPDPAETPFLVGHEAALARIGQSYRSGRMHHGLMLTGPAGIGKATLAFHVANHLLSHPRTAEAPETVGAPDPASRTFRLIAQGAHPSVLHLTRPVNERAKGFRSAITVDEVRRVGRFVGMTAGDGGHRVVIVDPADDLNANAANALLKSLEEPPADTLFVLVTHQPGRLLPTIRSRCQVIETKPLDDSQLAEALRRLGAYAGVETALDGSALHMAAGSVREALLMTQFGGGEIVAALGEVLRNPAFDTLAAVRIAEAVSARDGETRFAIFNRALLDDIARHAKSAVTHGGVEEAARLAAAWQEVSALIARSTTYNLDRRQHAMSLMRKVASLRGG